MSVHGFIEVKSINESKETKTYISVFHLITFYQCTCASNLNNSVTHKNNHSKFQNYHDTLHSESFIYLEKGSSGKVLYILISNKTEAHTK